MYGSLFYIGAGNIALSVTGRLIGHSRGLVACGGVIGLVALLVVLQLASDRVYQ